MLPLPEARALRSGRNPEVEMDETMTKVLEMALANPRFTAEVNFHCAPWGDPIGKDVDPAKVHAELEASGVVWGAWLSQGETWWRYGKVGGLRVVFYCSREAAEVMQ
jgi:hypothetical protein